MKNFHEEIAKVAYGLYEKSGKMSGHELDHWLEAERIISYWHKDQPKGQEEERPHRRRIATAKKPKTAVSPAK